MTNTPAATYQLDRTPAISESLTGSSRESRDWPEITRAVRQGDREALAVYYESYFDRVYREVRRATSADEAACLDLVQETFLKTIRCIKPMDEPALAVWTRAVARSTSYDWLRKQIRDRRLHQQQALRNDDAPEDESDIETAARLAWLELQIRQLPAELRKMVALRYRFGWSLARIAGQFGLKTGAVDGRLRRALEKIRQQALEDQIDE